MNTYSRLSVAFDHGQGCWLFDTDGNKYLDALSGIAVCGLGHAHPAVTTAISEQASQLIHTSNLYTITNQERLAEFKHKDGMIHKNRHIQTTVVGGLFGTGV